MVYLISHLSRRQLQRQRFAALGEGGAQPGALLTPPRRIRRRRLLRRQQAKQSREGGCSGTAEHSS